MKHLSLLAALQGALLAQTIQNVFAIDSARRPSET
jgi:hypothetical protein